MSTPPAAQRSKRARHARIGGLLALLVWILSTPGLIPALVALAGALDGQHRLAVVARGDQVLVVLQHPKGATLVEHEHSTVATILAALAESSGPRRDHVLAFKHVDPAVSTVAAEAPNSAPSLAPSLDLQIALLPVLRPPISAWPVVRPLATSALALVCIRSTTLLI